MLRLAWLHSSAKISRSQVAGVTISSHLYLPSYVLQVSCCLPVWTCVDWIDEHTLNEVVNIHWMKWLSLSVSSTLKWLSLSACLSVVSSTLKWLSLSVCLSSLPLCAYMCVRLLEQMLVQVLFQGWDDYFLLWTVWQNPVKCGLIHL